MQREYFLANCKFFYILQAIYHPIADIWQHMFSQASTSYQAENQEYGYLRGIT
jgi:hypothetical protein